MLKMRKTINDHLLHLAEVAQESCLELKSDQAVYEKLAKEMPGLFPRPDEFYTKSSIASDYDAMFIYILQKDENPESLKLILSLLFGIQEWEIEIDKDSMYTSLRTVKRFGNYLLLLRIAGIDANDFDYTIVTDTGTTLSGPVQYKKFATLDQMREDITPDTFYEQLKTASYQSFIQSKQAYICSLAAFGLPKKLPMPDDVTPALGTTYDLDLMYIGDKRGVLRSKIDQLLGYAGWAATINKQLGLMSLHTLLPIKCRNHILKIRVNILNACRNMEEFFLVLDLPDRLVYRTVRMTDPDYPEVVEAFDSNNGSS